MRHIVVFLAVAAILAALLAFFPPSQDPRVIVGDTAVKILLADTPQKRTQGLSNRESLAEDEGMLFVFPEEGIYGFWMKDMRFSIDILWLNSAGEVVHIVEDASPESYPASFTPEKAAQYVLELPAGFVRAHGVTLGSLVEL
ncbi:MAG: DUF192 domain-containing protein [Minisyncoccota bacterium]